MLPNPKFLKQSKSFWAQVKLISITLGYSNKEKVKTYSAEEIVECLKNFGLSTEHIIDSGGKVTLEGSLLVDYFLYRANCLEKNIKPNLMDKERAQEVFQSLFSKSHKEKVPFNKQKGDKRHYAYLTGIVNLLTEFNIGNNSFDSNPNRQVIITRNKKPIRTLIRRMDGTFPSVTNPYAVWEIKEYYGTTTFGSRVADGVYETMLDGYELEELRSVEGIDVKHYLIVDDYFTWWKLGKSYLCKIIDMLHEGFLDEVIFGREILERWPRIVESWTTSPSK